ncbi:hypothetical protein Hanom_Chr13g01226251 [Helianthus anomalus]
MNHLIQVKSHNHQFHIKLTYHNLLYNTLYSTKSQFIIYKIIVIIMFTLMQWVSF